MAPPAPPLETFQLMLDGPCSLILLRTSQGPCSAAELSTELGIPLTACYRRVRTLVRAGLLRRVRRRREAGEPPGGVYASRVRRASVVLDGDRLVVELLIEPDDGGPPVPFVERVDLQPESPDGPPAS